MAGIVGCRSVLGVPLTVLLVAVLTVAAALLTSETPSGGHVHAPGGSEHAAYLTGPSGDRITLRVYVLA